MSPHERHNAGIWQAFAAGMFAEAVVHSAQFEKRLDMTELEARTTFLDNHGDLMAALGVDMIEALKAFDAGRKTMKETRAAGELLTRPATPEDPPPNVPQLTGKPDRSLS